MQQPFVRHDIYLKYPPTYDFERGIIRIAVIDKYKNVKAYAITAISHADKILQYCYHVSKDSNGRESVASSIEITMHELVKGEKAPSGHVIDHWNNDPFDNRPENLRFATYAQNAQNKEKKEGCTSEYTGVHLDVHGKWRAFISVDSKMIYLGAFVVERDAAIMYDIHRIATMGPGVKTNGTLQNHEIEWIAKYGIPPGYEKVSRYDRDLPKNITENPCGSFTYSKMRKGESYSKNFDTLEETIAHKAEKEKEWADEEKDIEAIRVSKILRNANGIAIVYAKRKGVLYEIWVDDEFWGELSAIKWHLNKDGYAHTSKKNGQYLMQRYI